MKKFNPVFFLKPIFIGFRMLILHMTHIDIHQCRPAKKVLGLPRNYFNHHRSIIFPQAPCAGDTGNAVSDDDNGSVLLLHEEMNCSIRPAKTLSLPLRSYKKAPEEKKGLSIVANSSSVCGHFILSIPLSTDQMLYLSDCRGISQKQN